LLNFDRSDITKVAFADVFCKWICAFTSDKLLC